MKLIKKITLMVTLVCLLEIADTDRLVVPSGGYARVIGLQQEPLQAFTLSAWVNITTFPEGIVPLLTYLNAEATSQIAFFLRKRSMGILWGGPTTKPAYTDRRPRVYWGPDVKRTRRSAVDYSGGLGDIEDILGRTGRDNKWSPVNFIDVRELGVDDLQTSESEIMKRSGIAIREGRTSSSNPYPGWTNVPYELHMEETADIPSLKQEPRIITQPDGDDSFVYFNWNNPANPSITQNVWDASRTKPNLQKLPEPIAKIKPPPPSNENWSSQVENIDIKDTWNPNEYLKTKLLQTNVERPIWPKTIQAPPSEVKDIPNPPPQKPNNEFQKEIKSNRPRLPILNKPDDVTSSSLELNTKKIRPTKRPAFRYTQRTKPNAPKVIKSETKILSTTTVPTTTKLTIESLQEKTEKPERVPLWMLIKKPNTGTPTEPKRKYKPKPTPAPRKTNNYKPPSQHRSRIPTFKLRRNKINTPTRSNRNKNNRIQPSTTTLSAPKVPSKVDIRPSYSQRTRIKPTQSRSTNEFEKMKNPVMVQEGNKAVVYAVPIIDEKEFYSMYKQYQKSMHKANSKKTNIQELYKKMRMGTIQEREINENSLTIQPTEAPLPIPSTTNSNIPKITTPSEKPTLSSPESKVSEYPDDYYYYEYEDLNEDEIKDMNTASTQQDQDLETPKDFPTLTQDELYSLSQLYKPLKEVDQEVRPRPSHYQEPTLLSHEQLPPQYEEKPDKILVSKFQPSEKLESGFIPSKNILSPPPPRKEPNPTIFSANRQDFIAQGFQAQPVHVANTHDKTNTWISKQTNKQPQPVTVPTTQPTTKTTTTTKQKFQETPIQPIVESQSFFEPEVVQYPDPVVISDPNNPLGINIKELPYSFQEDGWYHIAFTWNGQNHLLSLYINGEKIGDIPNVLKNSDKLQEGGLYMLGRTLLPDLSDFDESSRFQGELSDVNLWAKDFSPEEVDAMFQCQYRPTVTQPLIWNQTPMVFYDNAKLVTSPPFCGVIT